MSKKLVGILVFGLLIAATALPVAGIMNNYRYQPDNTYLCSSTGTDWFLQWSLQYGGYRSGGPRPIGDIDEDGINEVIISGFDYVEPGLCKILSRDVEGAYIEEHSWTCPGYNVNVACGISVIDLDDDGDLEFCLSWMMSDNNGIYAYDWDGATLTQLDMYNGTGFDAVWVTIACDYDDDGDIELIISNDPSSGTNNKHITALGWDNENDEFIEEAFFTFAGYENNECTIQGGDTDNDGKTEIVATLTYTIISDCGTWVLNWNENSGEWEEETINTNYPDSTPLAVDIGDLNDNGIPEIAIGNWAGLTAAWLYEWNGAEYDEVWYEEYPDEGCVHYALAIGDADNDGLNELCVGTDQVHIYQWDGADYVKEAALTDPIGRLRGLNIGDCDSDGLNELKTCDISPGGSEYIYKSNNAPSAPEISGPTRVKKGDIIEYTFVSTDLEGHDVQYNISWGDKTYTSWIGTYSSGEEVIFNHTWNKNDNYTIKVQARDIHGALGDWSEFYVIVPRNKATYNTFFQSLFERFPNLYIILKQLLI